MMWIGTWIHQQNFTRISRFSKMKLLPSRLVRQRWPLSLIFKVWLMPDYFFYICYQSLLMKLDCKGKGSQ